MIFKEINIETWKRKEYYEHFSKDTPCTISLTTKIDITNLKKMNLKIYPALIFALTKTINKVEEFRINKNSEGILGIYEKVYPCYTYLKEGNEMFTNFWIDSIKCYSEFYKSYIFNISQYGDSIKIMGKENLPENTFPVSMIPWNSFDGFNLNLKNAYDYYLPIFTFGKFILDNKKYLIPLSIQVHHAVCDGFHLCRFIEKFQEFINNEANFLD